VENSKLKLELFGEGECEIIRDHRAIWLVAVFLLLLFLGIEFAAISASRLLPEGQGYFNKAKDQLSLLSLYQKDSNNKQDNISQLLIRENELNSSLSKTEELNHASVQIKEDGLFIKSKNTSNLFSLTVITKVVPEVKEGRLVFNLVSFESAGVVAPKLVVEKMTPGINGWLSDFFIIPDNVKPTGVKLYNGYLIIYGQPKN